MARNQIARRRKAPPAPRTIGATEFKATCLELLDAVKEHHVEVIVTKRGEPFAKLVPIDPPATRSAFGFLRGTVLDSSGVVEPEFEAWEESPSDPLNRE